MVAAVTGSMLRDALVCERRVHHDLSTAAAGRDPVSDFVRMLWAGGASHEIDVVSGLEGVVVDLRDVDAGRRVDATLAALRGGGDWILGARLEHGDRMGLPDLIRRVEGIWFVGDVKFGTPFADEGLSSKGEYLMQVGHYASLLEATGLGSGDRAFVIGRDGGLAWYDMHAASGRGDGTAAERVDRLVAKVRGIRDGTVATRPASASICGLCHWRSTCRGELELADDLTLVAGLGRSLREALAPLAPTVTALAGLEIEGVRAPGVGAARLARFRDRARLLRTPGAAPYARAPLGIVRHDRELHFDLEADPLRGVVYLHGILVRERRGGADSEDYVHFFAEGEEDERDAFAAAFRFLVEDPGSHVFAYSKFERSSYRTLQRRHPDVCSPEEVEALFSPERCTDLYFDVVASSTEWPLHSYGIKPIAKSLGFSWADADASGAASVGWYDEYRRTGDPAVRDRIVAYNRDDCVATAVLLDALIALPIRDSPGWPPAGGGVTAAADAPW